MIFQKKKLLDSIMTKMYHPKRIELHHKHLYHIIPRLISFSIKTLSYETNNKDMPTHQQKIQHNVARYYDPQGLIGSRNKIGVD